MLDRIDEWALKSEYIKSVDKRSNDFCDSIASIHGDSHPVCFNCPIKKECDAFIDLTGGFDFDYTEEKYKAAKEIAAAMNRFIAMYKTIKDGASMNKNVGASSVNHPQHYAQGSIECIDAMVETQGKDAVMNFCICNAMKYIWRHHDKNGIEDVRKAKWYIDKYIELYDEKPVEVPKTSSECYVPD